MITEIYSKRQKRLRGGFPDVYQYETAPEKLRIQIILLFKEICEYRVPDYEYESRVYVLSYESLCDYVHKALCSEYGRFSLVLDEDDSTVDDVQSFFLNTTDIEKTLDVIQVSLQCIEKEFLDLDIEFLDLDIVPGVHVENAISALNTRFQEHGVGYQYESGQIIRVDSQYTHSKAVRPVLSLLSDPMYKSANEEFLKAHEHYRKGDYKSCIQECSNAFESVLKVICDNKGWEYTEKATAKPLLDIVNKNGLLPKYKKSFFDNVRCALESGIPTIRNNISGHGHGSKEVTVPDYMAEHMLNLTASSILLLVKANKDT